VDEILEVKSETNELKETVVALNQDFQRSGQAFLKTVSIEL
jgi:hypothetical protein